MLSTVKRDDFGRWSDFGYYLLKIAVRSVGVNF